MSKRPISITIISWLFILMGAISSLDTVNHFRMYGQVGSPVTSSFSELILMGLIRLLAIVAGVMMLKRRSSGRWLCIAWMVFHVVRSFWHTPVEIVIHAAFLILLTYFLFRPRANKYFVNRES